MSKRILTVTVNPAVDVTELLVGADAQKGSAFRPSSPLANERRKTPTSASGGTSEPISPGLRMRCSTNFVLSAGGKGVNVARVLRALRVSVLAAGVAGGDTGEFFQKLLRKEKIPAEFLNVRGATRLNVTVLGPRPGGCTRAIGEGPRLTPAEIRQFETRYRRWLRQSRFVILCGRNAVGAPVNWYARLVRLAQQEDVPAAVDTSGAALCAALQARPFLIKPNLQEAQTIVRHRLNSSTQIKKAVRYFHGRGIRVVLLSLGERGAVVSDGRNIWHARPPAVRAINDLGCGDALLAGFIQAYCAGRKSLPEALRQAVACGTANALNSTPGLIRPSDVLRLKKGTVVKRLGE